VLALLLFAILAGGALNRTRDSVFAALAAACVATTAGQTFFDAALVNDPAISALTVMIVGVGLAQHLRRGNAAAEPYRA
jgi:hypothetical protein